MLQVAPEARESTLVAFPRQGFLHREDIQRLSFRLSGKTSC